MAERSLRILQVSTADTLGGAEKVAWELFQAYRARGLDSWLAVGRKHTDDAHVLLVPNDDSRGPWARGWIAVGNALSPLVERVRGAGRLRHWLHLVGQPGRLLDRFRGYEDMDFPGTWRLLELAGGRPDVVHCHNLHGTYFDLRALPWLSQQLPVILTLHDSWLLSGHCAYTLDCQRWKDGCGHCPDLTVPQAIRRDATSQNWHRKQRIFAQSRLYVATPCRWLMQKVEQSMLAAAVTQARVIPYGLDLSIFRPRDRRTARSALGIPHDVTMLLFTAHLPRRNVWKDYRTIRSAVGQVAEHLDARNVLFVALGEDAPAERVGGAEVRFVPFQKDPQMVARYYQAADLYLHAARADTFPNTVLEALACGTPVVATAVGGIPEQVKGLGIGNSGLRIGNCELQGADGGVWSGDGELNRYGTDEATGVLVSPGDADQMAQAILLLLSDDELRRRLARNAVEDAQRRFDLSRQVEGYLGWYREILEDWRAQRPH